MRVKPFIQYQKSEEAFADCQADSLTERENKRRITQRQKEATAFSNNDRASLLISLQQPNHAFAVKTKEG